MEEERLPPHTHAASLTALQRPPLTFGLITTTITPYCHTQSPPPSLICHLTRSVNSLKVIRATVATNPSSRITVGSRQRLLLIPDTVPKHTLKLLHSHHIPLFQQHCKLIFIIILKMTTSNCVATIPLFRALVFFNEILLNTAVVFLCCCILSQEGSDTNSQLD